MNAKGQAVCMTGSVLSDAGNQPAAYSGNHLAGVSFPTDVKG
jgi:hypothetical protein